MPFRSNDQGFHRGDIHATGIFHFVPGLEMRARNPRIARRTDEHLGLWNALCLRNARLEKKKAFLIVAVVIDGDSVMRTPHAGKRTWLMLSAER